MGAVHSTVHKSCRWHRRKEDRPAEILTAALKTFSVKGFAATKLVEVAKEAGVSKGTLYLYFESKEALFKEVVSEFVLPQIAKAEEHAEQYSGSTKELMFNLVDHWRTHVLETELSGISKMMIAEASNFPDLAHFYLENVIQRTRHFVANLIELGIQRGEFRKCNSQYAARAFLTPMVFSAIWQYSLAPFDESYDINEYLNLSMDIFMRGILKENQG
ncbi:MAG: TetR/AcrR family transcriptional regulator [Gammaproteobacteria bacterium]|nr:TetR/AcrR family transcriptional regulator [Gammaproteobacteria bacterium]MCW9032341.1 TetR/AcrR family transcriptional regulator [Gammaproteobacteria bacterium]